MPRFSDKPLSERLSTYRVEDRGCETPCWIWTNVLHHNGYGVVGRARVIGNRSILAHRASYMVHIGPIPLGQVVHHLCEQKACINPAHLQALTPAEHNHVHGAALTHCVNGHEFTPENTYQRTTGSQRACRACAAAQARAYRARLRSAA